MPGTVSLPGTGKSQNLRSAGTHRQIAKNTPGHAIKVHASMTDKHILWPHLTACAKNKS